MKNLLIVANTPSENTMTLAQAVFRGASHADIENTQTQFLSAFDATPEHVLAADGIVIGTTENFAAMSGAIKDFFERIYYPCLESKQGMPYALYIRAGNDGTGTKEGVNKIITGLRWKPICETMILKGEYQHDFEVQCEELGLLMAAGLDNAIF